MPISIAPSPVNTSLFFSELPTCPKQTSLPTATPFQAQALDKRTVCLGSGEERKNTYQQGLRLSALFKNAGMVLGGILLSPVAIAAGLGLGITRAVLQIPRLINERILEPKAQKRVEVQTPYIAALKTPMENSITASENVILKLEQHAKATGSTLSTQQIKDLVATGEWLADALAKDDNADNKGSLFVNGHTVTSSMHTTRALSWYMMAAAAGQDVKRTNDQLCGKTVSDMAQSGAFIMKDPGNRIYSFLAAAPTAAPRMSTHFAERVAHSDKHKAMGLIPTSKPAQKGIEDYRKQLPGQGGTVLFDKLTNDELFVKFESVGCPPYFLVEPHQGKGQAIARFFAAIDRNVGHATNFVLSLFTGSSTHIAQRQEHVYKGILKDTVAAPFAELIELAVEQGVIDADSRAVGKGVHQFGLPFINAALDQIDKAATAKGNTRVLTQLAKVKASMEETLEILGSQSDRHGIARRGAEVHISLNPALNKAV